jgi:hypothetical protein
MIIGDTFLWLHLPKTGGTTMNQIFRQLAIPGIAIDPDGERCKHDSVALRQSQGSWRAGGRARFITARRLAAWLLSDWKHKRRHCGLPDLAFEPVRCGLYYSLRLGGVWVAADWWLRYFEVDATVTALRLESLVDDFNARLLPLLPATTPPLQAPPRLNAAPLQNNAEALFSPQDLAVMRVVNPLWSQWESRLYGAMAAQPS